MLTLKHLSEDSEKQADKKCIIQVRPRSNPHLSPLKLWLQDLGSPESKEPQS